MLKITLISILLLFLTTSGLTQNEDGSQHNLKNKIVYVKSSKVNVRALPNTECSIKGQLQRGDKVDLIEVKDNWALVNYKSEKCWIYFPLLSVNPVKINKNKPKSEYKHLTDEAIHDYMQSRYEYYDNFSEYDPDIHDDLVIRETATHFGISKSRVLKAWENVEEARYLNRN